MLREIHIDKFNKIITQFKPQIFNSLTLLDHKPYNPTVQYYHGNSLLHSASDNERNLYQLYLTNQQLENILDDVPFIQASPKLLIIKTEKDSILIEERIDNNLYEDLLVAESKVIPVPYIDEIEARTVLQDIQMCLRDFQKHSIPYYCINPKNIVKSKRKWQLSVAALLLKNQKKSEDYYKSDVKEQHLSAYALGTLLFKLLIGFIPFEKQKKRMDFEFKEYLKYLDKEQNKKFLKIYYFCEKMLVLSEQTKKLIETSLKGQMTLDQFYAHPFFTSPLNKKQPLSGNSKQIKMLTIFDQKYQSLIMAAIERRKNYSQEKINPKLLFCQQLSKKQVVTHLKKHHVLCQVQFSPVFTQQNLKNNSKPQLLVPVTIPYFYQAQFDPENDYPCRQLQKLIKRYTQSQQTHTVDLQEIQAQIKLYAYPYTMVFELLKFDHLQPYQIQLKIRKSIDHLLQISSLYPTKKVQPLHKTVKIISSFQDIKLSFRQNINQLYKHFLNEAIKRYNIKKDAVSSQERYKQRQLGLEYYRLCLKLMEASLLVRKQGKNLDLGRIETAQRKQIESDLNDLLKQYFPNRIQLA